MPTNCFIDVETTGVIPGKHSIIQIGMTIGFLEYSFLMQPFTGATIDDMALKVNGVSREILSTYPAYTEGKGKFIDTLDIHVDKYNKMDKMFFIAYNATFDERFIRHMIGTYFGSYFWWPVIDVAMLAAMFLYEKRHKMIDFKLGTVYKEIVGKPLEDAHEALSDIKATKEIFDIVTGGAYA